MDRQTDSDAYAQLGSKIIKELYVRLLEWQMVDRNYILLWIVIIILVWYNYNCSKDNLPFRIK